MSPFRTSVLPSAARRALANKGAPTPRSCFLIAWLTLVQPFGGSSEVELLGQCREDLVVPAGGLGPMLITPQVIQNRE